MADPKKKLPLPELIRQFWKPYFTLAAYLRPYRKRFVAGLACGIIAGVLSGVAPLILKYVGEQLGLEAGAMNFNPLAQTETVDEGPRIGRFAGIILIIPLTVIARGIFAYLNAYCMAWVSFRVLRDLRSQLFRHITTQSLDYFNKAKTGRLISRVLNDTRMAQNALTTIAGDVIKQPVAVITGVVVLVMIDWRFSLTTLVLFPICIIPVAIFGKKVRQAGKAEENEAGAMAVILQETFSGIRVIKSFAREDYQAAQFEKSSETQCRNSMRVRKSIDIVQPLIESVSALGVVLALIYVIVFDVSFIKFGALCLGIFMLYNPAKALSRIPMLMQKCLASTTYIFEILETRPTIQDAPDAVEIQHARGEIEFDHVTFGYGTEKVAVRDVSLKIEAGRQYALVGASGAGKTTMLALLLRFYDPQAGVIRLDGRDIRTIRQTSLREQIGIVTQESFLFHDTIYENIRYGRLDATRAEIEAAAKLAYAHDFIMAQPNGYDTVVGDKGSLLSGGQQQRLAIARALLKNAPILLLDEATSALDSESERIIQAALERLSQGRTVVAIAHRLSTILKSDQIVVMDDGRIVEVGTHRELLEKSGLYRRLYEIQFQHEEAAAAA
jgi:ABC-type multidrug transport system, ATPase and permease components